MDGPHLQALRLVLRCVDSARKSVQGPEWHCVSAEAVSHAILLVGMGAALASFRLLFLGSCLANNEAC